MPRGDGTGPVGSGRMSGRGAGFCAGYDLPGFANAYGGGFGFGRGRGRGYGRAMGWRLGYPVPYENDPAVPAGSEKEVLKSQARYLREALDSVNRRLEAFESEKE
ncbi:MAG: DUF5320 domain-containing protein [Chitinispirillaceae bacterium]